MGTGANDLLTDSEREKEKIKQAQRADGLDRATAGGTLALGKNVVAEEGGAYLWPS